MKRFWVGALYFALVVLALVVVALVGTVLYHVMWVPLIGIDGADLVNMVLMITAGGFVGHRGALGLEDFMDRFGV